MPDLFVVTYNICGLEPHAGGDCAGVKVLHDDLSGDYFWSFVFPGGSGTGEPGVDPERPLSMAK